MWRKRPGVTLGNWSSGSAWGDYDGDGRLDLYVTGYVHFDRDNLPISGIEGGGLCHCKYRGVTVNCGPRGLKGEPDHLFHNNGDGTFTDVTVKAGVEDKDRYYGFTAIFVDMNGNGKPDLVVGNDSEPNYLYINKGDGTFDDQSYVSGFALNKDGREIASMGIAAGDYENNGLIDLFVTDFGDDYKVLYHNDGDASFTDVSYKAGIAQTTIPFVGWGDGFHRLRQRRLAGPFHGQWPCLSRRSTSTTGAPLLPSGRCCSTTCRAGKDGNSNTFRR